MPGVRLGRMLSPSDGCVSPLDPITAPEILLNPKSLFILILKITYRFFSYSKV
jgi:hypothetical protein